MAIRNDINDYLINNHKIYLSKYILEQEVEYFKANQKKKSIFSMLDELAIKYKDVEKFKTQKEWGLNVTGDDEHAIWAKNQRKVVIQYTMEGKKLKEFESIYAAGQALGKDKGFSNISRAARGKGPTKGKENACYGFRWSLK